MQFHRLIFRYFLCTTMSFLQSSSPFYTFTAIFPLFLAPARVLLSTRFLDSDLDAFFSSSLLSLSFDFLLTTASISEVSLSLYLSSLGLYSSPLTERTPFLSIGFSSLAVTVVACFLNSAEAMLSLKSAWPLMVGCYEDDAAVSLFELEVELPAAGSLVEVRSFLVVETGRLR